MARSQNRTQMLPGAAPLGVRVREVRPSSDESVQTDGCLLSPQSSRASLPCRDRDFLRREVASQARPLARFRPTLCHLPRGLPRARKPSVALAPATYSAVTAAP